MPVQHIYEFTAVLDEFEPKITRRFQVRSSIPLRYFAYIIMILFEMRGGHYYALSFPPEGRMKKTRKFTLPWEVEDTDLVTLYKDTLFLDLFIPMLNDIPWKVGQDFSFEYDYGDGWTVKLHLDAIHTVMGYAKDFPKVLEGTGYGIIENVGGPGGLTEFTNAYVKQQGQVFEEYQAWCGRQSFDINAFNLDDMNQRIKRLPKIYEKTQYLQNNINNQTVRDLMHGEFI